MTQQGARKELLDACRGVVFLFWDGDDDGDHPDELSCRGCGNNPLREHGPHCAVKRLSEAVKLFEASIK